MFSVPHPQIKEIGVVENGKDRTGFSIKFDDGSKLVVYAEVKLPPMKEMTPRKILKYNIQTGETYEDYDNGYGEAIDLTEQTQAAQWARYMENLVAQSIYQPQYA